MAMVGLIAQPKGTLPRLGSFHFDGNISLNAHAALS